MAEAVLTVRDATLQDVQSLSELGRKVYRIYFAHLWSRRGFSRFLDGEFHKTHIHNEIAEGKSAYYLIDLNGETIGFAKTRPRQKMPHSQCCGTVLEKLYFEPQYTNGGLGQRVLAHLVSCAEASNAGLMWLEVLKTNDRARRAYEKAGFSVIGEIPFSTDRHEIGFYIMARMLSQETAA